MTPLHLRFSTGNVQLGGGFRVRLPYYPSREKPEESRGGPAGQWDRTREVTTNRTQSVGTAGMKGTVMSSPGLPCRNQRLSPQQQQEVECN